MRYKIRCNALKHPELLRFTPTESYVHTSFRTSISHLDLSTSNAPNVHCGPSLQQHPGSATTTLQNTFPCSPKAIPHARSTENGSCRSHGCAVAAATATGPHAPHHNGTACCSPPQRRKSSRLRVVMDCVEFAVRPPAEVGLEAAGGGNDGVDLG
jgi:hypothetical protein